MVRAQSFGFERRRLSLRQLCQRGQELAESNLCDDLITGGLDELFYLLIGSAKLNGLDPVFYLHNVLDRIAQASRPPRRRVAGDAIMAAAALDRLLHRSTVINIRGDSYRLKEKRQAGSSVQPQEALMT